MFATYYNFWNYWDVYHSVQFDGPNRKIYVNPDVSAIDVKLIYSEWKEWLQIDKNSQWEQAIRVVGGDPIGDGLFSGDVYFLTNGWIIVLDHSIQFNGVIYSDDFPSPFVTTAGNYISTNQTASLVVRTDATSTIQSVAAQVGDNISSSLSTSLGSSITDAVVTAVGADISTTVDGSVNTAISNNLTNIAAAVRTELGSELAHILTLQNGQGLDSNQATMLLEIYRLYGLDPTRPLVVTNTARTAGDLTQSINTSATQTTITRTS